MTTTTAQSSKTLNIVLWIVQILLALSLVWSFYMKVLHPADKLADMWPWTADYPTLSKLTAILDLFAAVGLALPWIARSWPRVIFYAACGLALLMVAACIFHISRGEASLIGPNIAFMLMAGFVAWGRARRVPVNL